MSKGTVTKMTDAWLQWGRESVTLHKALEDLVAFALAFDKSEIPEWAERYLKRYPDYDLKVESQIAPRVKEAGYFTKDDFLEICKWKEQRERSRRFWDQNQEGYIHAVTKAALATDNQGSPFVL